MPESSGNLFENLPQTLGAEDFLALVPVGSVKIERIVSPTGTAAPGGWYCQENAEWVMVARGQAAILFEGEPSPRRLKAGDYLFIAAGRRHRVEWTGKDEPTIWLAVHFPAA